MAKTSALPKFVQLSEMLIREIAAGHLTDGARLPPERDMADDLGVAVGTLRKALADDRIYDFGSKRGKKTLRDLWGMKKGDDTCLR